MSRPVVTRWLASESFERFVRDYWQSRPYAETGTAADVIPLLTSGTIGTLLEAADELHPLVVRNGMLLSQHAPRSVADLRDLLAGGCSLVLRRTERRDPKLGTLAVEVEERLGGAAAIQLYVTPSGYHSFGWHYDAEEVLIIQTAGRKEYLLRENTINPRPLITGMPTDQQFEKESSTTVSNCSLDPGDWLYIPSGWWHMARAEVNSLSISIGVTPTQR